MNQVERSYGAATPEGSIANGAIGGVLGGVVLALVLQLTGQIGEAPKLLELGESAIVGWLFMLLSGLLGGAVFGALVHVGPVRERVDGLQASVGAGVAYGVALWIVLPVLLLPIWVEAVTFGSMSVPNVDLPSLVGFAVYGLVVGAVYEYLVE